MELLFKMKTEGIHGDDMTERELVQQASAELKAAMYEIPDIAAAVDDSVTDNLAKVYVGLKKASELLKTLEARYAD